eukprot:g15285.t1
MCGCIEDMPEVSRADCSVPAGGDNFNTCTNNDLRTRVEEVYPNDMLANLVGTCDDKDTTTSSSDSFDPPNSGSSSGSC